MSKAPHVLYYEIVDKHFDGDRFAYREYCKNINEIKKITGFLPVKYLSNAFIALDESFCHKGLTKNQLWDYAKTCKFGKINISEFKSYLEHVVSDYKTHINDKITYTLIDLSKK